MDIKSRILIIADIEPFVTTQIQDILIVSKFYNLNRQEELDHLIDWIVNQILTDYYQMIVIHHYRHDIYKCIYSEIKHQLIYSFSRCVNISDFNLLKGCEVKTLVNDRDLFITRRLKYNGI